MEHNLMVTSSPHIVDKASTQKLMLNVIIAMMPAVIMSGVIFGIRAWLLIAVTVVSCVGFEWLWCKLMKKPIPLGDLSAVVTGILLAFNMPSTLPFYMAVIGAAVAIIVVKQFFGGMGYNFANPAIVGRIVLAVSFAGAMTAFPTAKTVVGVDALAGATPLVVAQEGANLSLMNLLVGNHGGVLGETCAIALLIGGLYLIVTKTISITIPAVYIGTVAVFALLTGQDVVVQLLSGGLLLGAFFMATDYVTCPYTTKGKIVFAVGLGLITGLIRFFGSMAEGVSYAILFMNLLVPFINRLTRRTPVGGAEK